MNFSRFFLITVLAFLVSGLYCCKQDPWESLFNGEDLEGWTVKCLAADQGKVYWSVEDACISCNSIGDQDHNYVWLTTEKEFSNFHLKLKFQIFRESGGNSGVQFRSIYDISDSANYGGWLNGPQVDLHGPAPFRTGLIYDETEGVRRWIHPSLSDWRIEPEQAPESALLTTLFYYEDDPESWNSLEIICKEMLVETVVNGNPVTVFDGEGILNDEVHSLHRSGKTGCIGFQLHMNDELKIRFKDIYIKEFKQ